MQQFETEVRDNNVNAGLAGAVKFTYRDVRDLITAVREQFPAGDLWTSYQCYEIVAYGADGREGGEGENADINSWEAGK